MNSAKLQQARELQLVHHLQSNELNDTGDTKHVLLQGEKNKMAVQAATTTKEFNKTSNLGLTGKITLNEDQRQHWLKRKNSTGCKIT